ncbi:hypothetical protein [Clostridium hydrogenum]|uniref:hypothetical protein n=1 Tax=Clostridium hydrogenum TaxID=2855764 RepID=UPI001F36095F|nr:hypothetical protein [Clostridium hydrogenum]
MNSKNNNEMKNGKYMATGLCLGMSIGLAIGQFFFHNALPYMSTGMCVGLAIGVFIDSKNAKKNK